MNRKKILYLKLFFVIIASFFISSFLIRDVFIARTPKVNSNFLSNLLQNVKDFANNASSSLLVRFKPSPKNQQLPEIATKALQSVAKGVRASSESNVSLTEYTQNEIEWIDIEYRKSDGSIVHIKVPKGTEHIYSR